MKVKALRGICIGVDRHLKVGDTAELDAATAQYLVNIKAVETVDEPAKAKDEPKVESVPATPGKKEK